MELTLEMSLVKWPPEADLPGLWENNRLAIMEYMRLALAGGVRGYVLDEWGCIVTGARISVSPLSETVATVNFGVVDTRQQSDEFGKYYRLLAPGQ